MTGLIEAETGFGGATPGIFSLSEGFEILVGGQLVGVVPAQVDGFSEQLHGAIVELRRAILYLVTSQGVDAGEIVPLLGRPVRPQSQLVQFGKPVAIRPPLRRTGKTGPARCRDSRGSFQVAARGRQVRIAPVDWPSPDLFTTLNKRIWGKGIAVLLEQRSWLRRSGSQLRSGSSTASGELRRGLVV